LWSLSDTELLGAGANGSRSYAAAKPTATATHDLRLDHRGLSGQPHRLGTLTVGPGTRAGAEVFQSSQPQCVLGPRRQAVNPETVGRREQPPRGPLDPVAQRLRLPFGVPEFIDRIVSGTTNEVGRRTVMVLITTWDMAGGGPFAASSVATVGLSTTVDTVQKLFMGAVFDPLLKRLGADNVKFRASLCASQLIGLGILRYAVRLEPIASMKAEALADAMAPTLRRYLVGNVS
jgi:hypothetical protein